MRAALGSAGVSLAFVAAAAGAVLLAAGAWRRDRRWLWAGRGMVVVVLVGAAVAAAAMEWALVSRDFSLAYVADNGSRATPLLYTVASLWGALEGSILLWGLVLAGYLAAVAWRFRARAADPLVATALAVGLAVAAFFFGLMLGPADPFRLVAGAVPPDGPGPNPLLQNHPLMAFHPPILYLGYVGFTVPFAFAVAALVTGRLDEGWLAQTRRATLFAWGCLTVGVVLGGWWSYEVLGWGGYWAWDPVENASLLPWLTGTAYLHSVMVQERRGMLRVWNLSLVLATFCLTILGTFLTRSGVINSVHAFTQSPIGPWLLTFLAAAALASIGLVGWRADRLRAPGRIDSPLSREAAFLANNVLFAAFALVVLIGTVFPLLAEAYDGRQLSVGEPYFDDMTRPIGLALLFLMAVAPALPWRATTADVLHRRVFAPAVAAAAAMAVASVAGLRGLAPVATVGLAVFALAGIARQFAIGAAAQRRRGAGRLGALGATVAGNRRLYGGLVVHAGVVAIAVVLAMAAPFTAAREARLAEGEAATLRGYRVTFVGAEQTRSARKETVSARFRVERGGRVLGEYAPALSQFAASTQAIGTPSVRTGLLEDLYLTLIAAPDDRGRVVVGIQVNPLVVWLWVGAGVMAAGTVLAAWPARRPPFSPPPAPAPADHAVPDGTPQRTPVPAGAEVTL
ncbi:MAG: heme lyase CcmF/NrfE family subunit [Actinomycetota bacterium]